MERITRETKVVIKECDEGSVKSDVPFLTHMIDTFIRHSGLKVCIEGKDFLGYDDHHLVEDIAITLGRYLNKLFRDRLRNRFAWSLIPMDEALALCSMDVSGRGGFYGDLSFSREEIGGLALENVSHFFDTLAKEARITLHLRLLAGSNDHHKVEALFKAFARCVATVLGRDVDGSVTTKGILEL